MKQPFTLFSEHLEEIYDFIDSTFTNETCHIKNKLKKIIKEISYNDLMTFKYNKFFDKIGEKEFYDDSLKSKRDEFEPYFDNLINKLKINNEERFDTTVKINVNLFIGYTTEELCKTFEKINKYNSKLTETELLACRLFTITNFKIDCVIMEAFITKSIKEFYLQRQENEILSCYNFDDKLNAYDFMIGFQNYSHQQCSIICEVDNDGLSLFFKIYKTIYKGSFDHTFTNENINDFIYKMNEAIKILIEIRDRIFMEKLVDGSGSKLFDSCNKKLSSLKKNNVYVIIASIIGYNNKKTDRETIIKSIEKCLLYHFFVNEITDKDKKNQYQLHDTILYEAGGAYIDSVASRFYELPSSISDKITRDAMNDVIELLMKENIKSKGYEIRSNGKDKIDKRRCRKFHEKVLLYYYYKIKVPTEFLKNNFWIEHICPFSSSWNQNEEIDIDRLGNIIPIIDELNNKRKTKHINDYTKHDKLNFIKFLDNIIPENNVYNEIIHHKETKPHIFDSCKYNYLCEQNEITFKNTFIKHLFEQ